MMKKLCLCALAALVLAGCGEKKSEEENSSDISRLRSVSLSAAYELSMPDSLKFDPESRYFSDIDIYLSWPESINGKKPVALQEKIIEKAFGSDRKKSSLEEALKQLQTLPLGYEEEKDVTQKEIKSIPEEAEMRISALTVEAFPCYMSKKALTYYVMSYYYPAGAAHGVGNTYYLNYDVENDRLITTGALFSDMNEVKRTIYRELTEKQAVEGYLLVDEVPNPENFHINGYSISFVFNPYEVAAYAAGTVEVSIPAYELADYMTDYGKQLLGVAGTK